MKFKTTHIIVILFLLIIVIFHFGIYKNNTVILSNSFENIKNHLEFEILPDSKFVKYKDYEFILINPTDKFKHGILGDNLEARELLFYNEIDYKIINFSPQVFEGLFPIISEDLIVTTLSGNGKGAQVVVYDFNGTRTFESDVLSSGWRHVLGVEKINDKKYIFNIVKPHILGELELLRFTNKSLEKVDSLRGYSTHRIGSRNLNIFEFYKDKYLIIPTFDFKSIGIISFDKLELREMFRIEIGEEIKSIENKNGEIYVNDKIIKINLESN